MIQIVAFTNLHFDKYINITINYINYMFAAVKEGYMHKFHG